MKRGLPALLLLALLAAPLPGEAGRESRKAFLRARAAVAEGRFREALELYRQVLSELPEDAVVRYEYAQLLRDLNVPDEAVGQAREAVRLDPTLPEARRLLGSLELAASERDPKRLDRAIEELRAANRLAPRDMPTVAQLARALLARGRASEAARLLEDSPESQSQPGLMRLAAEAKARSGRSREAEAIYRELLQLDPADRETAAALVELYEGDDRVDLAIDLLERMEKEEGDAAASERIALNLARAGRFQEAEKRAKELAARRPENRAIRRLLAGVLFEKGATAEGEKLLRALLERDPEDAATRRSLAMELARERRFAEARAELGEVLRRAAGDPKKRELRQSAEVELGYLSMLEKDFAGAKRILEPIAIAGSSVNDRAVRILLSVARESEDSALGFRVAHSASAAHPGSAEWKAALAEFQLRSGDVKDGEAELSRLAASEDLEEVLPAADAFARLKKFQSAAQVAREASERFPESVETLFRLGSSLERAGDYASAEKVFLKLLDLRPNDSVAQNYLGYMWADRGVRLEEARQLLEKAVAREPRNGAYQDSLGWLYFRLGRLEAAEKHLLEAQRREPDDPTIEEHLGDLLERQGNLKMAISHWERALALKHEEPEKVRKKLSRSRSGASTIR